jgi:glucan phosphoethanolaminetransferase (alkaline phosphatase superfamily)
MPGVLGSLLSANNDALHCALLRSECCAPTNSANTTTMTKISWLLFSCFALTRGYVALFFPLYPTSFRRDGISVFSIYLLGGSSRRCFFAAFSTFLFNLCFFFFMPLSFSSFSFLLFSYIPTGYMARARLALRNPHH